MRDQALAGERGVLLRPIGARAFAHTGTGNERE
jgi:hypothetical protein